MVSCWLIGIVAQSRGGLLVIIGGQGGGNRLLLPTAPTSVSVVEKAYARSGQVQSLQIERGMVSLRCKVPGGLPSMCAGNGAFLGRRRRLLWRFCGKLPRWSDFLSGSFRRI